MDKIITVGGKEVGFRATALTPRLYRHKLGRDIVRDMARLQSRFAKAVKARKLKKPKEDAAEWQKKEYEEAIKEAKMSVMDLEIFENVSWIMARQYAPETVPDTPEAWLDGLDTTFSIYEILPQIMELWQLNQSTTSTPKKK